MSTFLSRLKEEEGELSVRIANLKEYFNAPKHNSEGSISSANDALLVTQYNTMLEYRRILRARIALYSD